MADSFLLKKIVWQWIWIKGSSEIDMILTSDWTMLCERQKGLLKKTKKGEHGPFVAPLFLDEPLLFIRYDTPTIIGKHFGTFDKNTGCGTQLSCSFFTEKSFGLFSLWLDTPRSKKVSVSLHLFDGNRFLSLHGKCPERNVCWCRFH